MTLRSRAIYTVRVFSREFAPFVLAAVSIGGLVIWSAVPTPSEARVRFSSVLIEWAGLALVVYDLSQTRRLFRLPNWFKSFLDKLGGVRGRGNVSLSMQGGSVVTVGGRMRARLGTANLVRRIEGLERELDDLVKDIDDQFARVRDTVEKRASALQTQVAELRDQLAALQDTVKNLATGGMRLAVLGVVLVAAGVFLGNMAEEVTAWLKASTDHSARTTSSNAATSGAEATIAAAASTSSRTGSRTSVG